MITASSRRGSCPRRAGRGRPCSRALGGAGRRRLDRARRDRAGLRTDPGVGPGRRRRGPRRRQGHRRRQEGEGHRRARPTATPPCAVPPSWPSTPASRWRAAGSRPPRSPPGSSSPRSPTDVVRRHRHLRRRGHHGRSTRRTDRAAAQAVLDGLDADQEDPALRRRDPGRRRRRHRGPAQPARALGRRRHQQHPDRGRHHGDQGRRGAGRRRRARAVRARHSRRCSSWPRPARAR